MTLSHKMKMSEQGYDLIREFEGLRLNAYRDAVGVWTIGYGHTSAAGLPEVLSGMTITRSEAEQIFRHDVAQFAEGVERLLRVELSPAQFSSLVSFAYNVGISNFRHSSVLKLVNARNFHAVPGRLALWNKAGGKVLPGLVRRRAAEARLFMSGTPVTQPNNSRTMRWQALAALIRSAASWLASILNKKEQN